MRRSSRLIILLLGALPLAVQAALPQRTFVASNGVDTNPCSLAAPCRSFGAAVTAVAAGGEVVVLDSAGYGAVTIAKSVSIVAPPGLYAGVSVASGTGVTVDGAGINVVIRGLSITNQGGNVGNARTRIAVPGLRAAARRKKKPAESAGFFVDPHRDGAGPKVVTASGGLDVATPAFPWGPGSLRS